MGRFSNFLRPVLRVVEADQSDSTVAIEKIDGNLTPNMRALRLVMSLADQLLSMGAPASSVVHMALGITDVYCARKVHFDINYTQITASQDRGIDREPLTLVRTVSLRETNYRLMRLLQSLATDIANRKVTLNDAETQLDRILSNTVSYPHWVVYLGGGGLSVGSALLYTTSIPVVITALFVGIFISWLVNWLGRHLLPLFFVQIIAAITVMLSTTGLTWLVNRGYLDVLDKGFNPTVIAVTGIVLLVAGMMIVGAFQDAIDEYYVTASARLLKVIMATTGIVIGVGIGLYLAKQLGVTYVPTPDRLSLTSTFYQYIGAIIISASFALSNHAKPGSIIVTGLVGLLGYYVFLFASSIGLSSIPANAAAGLIIGFLATFISRMWRLPSLAVINAGIVPLVPGLTLYNGLMDAVLNPGTSDGINLLFRAIAIAVAIATGASFGLLIGRPTRRGFVILHNSLPERPLHNRHR